MNGFGYIRSKIINKTMEELSKDMKVSKQLIQMWESGKRKIPEKRLSELEKLSGIPQRYFLVEELSVREELEIKRYRMKSEVDQILNDCIEYDENGISNLWISEGQLEIVRDLENCELDVAVLELQDKIGKIIGQAGNGAISISERIERKIAADRLIDIIEMSRSKKILFQIIRTMELFFGINVEKYRIFGADNPFRCDQVSDETELIQKMLQVLNDDREKELATLTRELEETKQKISILDWD